MYSKFLPTRRRLAKLKRRAVPVFLAVLALAILAWPAGASATVGTPQYPNLRGLPPQNLTLDQADVGGVLHHLVRFTAYIYNGGPGALEVQRSPQLIPASGLAELTQRIYEDPVGFRDEKLGAVPLTPTTNFMIPDIARYELWTQRAFRRATATQFKRGKPLYAKPDVQFCVTDSRQIDLSTSPIGVSVPGIYRECTAVVQGISPGWADMEAYYDDNQSIDVGTASLPDGKYVLRTIADPDNLLWESPGKADPARESQAANQGVASFDIVQGAITWNG